LQGESGPPRAEKVEQVKRGAGEQGKERRTFNGCPA
jgi:hypothetical protein